MVVVRILMNLGSSSSFLPEEMYKCTAYPVENYATWARVSKSRERASGARSHKSCCGATFTSMIKYFWLKNLNFYVSTHHITKYLHNNVFIAPNWTQLKFLTLLCKVFGFWYQIMSRITVFSCQILCRESRCFWSHILTLQKAAGATKQLFRNSDMSM